MADLKQTTPNPTARFDLERLAQIHRDNVGRASPQAGQLREVNMSTTDGDQRLAYTRPEHIEQYARAIAAEIKAHNNFRDLPPDQWAQKVGQTLTDLNTLRPFRDGNDATTKAFAQELAKERGLTLDFDRVSAQQWERATKDSIAGNSSTVSGLLASIARPERTLDRPMTPSAVRPELEPVVDKNASLARETRPEQHASAPSLPRLPLEPSANVKELAGLSDIAARYGLTLQQPEHVMGRVDGTVIEQTNKHLVVKVGVSIAVAYEKDRLNEDIKVGQAVNLTQGKQLTLVQREAHLPTQQPARDQRDFVR